MEGAERGAGLCPSLIYLPSGCTLRCQLQMGHGRIHRWEHQNTETMGATEGMKWQKAKVAVTWEGRTQ